MMFSLQNLGVIKKIIKKKNRKYSNLMLIESVFLIVSLLNIHKAFVSREKTSLRSRRFLYSKTDRCFLLRTILVIHI